MKISKLQSKFAVAALFLAMGNLYAMDLKFEDVDLNKDGVISEAELVMVIKHNFLVKDKDSSHNLDAKEWDEEDLAQ